MKSFFLLLFLTSCTQLSVGDLEPKLSVKTKIMKKKLDKAICEKEGLETKIQMLKTELHLSKLSEIESRLDLFESVLPQILENPDQFSEIVDAVSSDLFRKDREELADIVNDKGEYSSLAERLLNRLSLLTTKVDFNL